MVHMREALVMRSTAYKLAGILQAQDVQSRAVT